MISKRSLFVSAAHTRTHMRTHTGGHACIRADKLAQEEMTQSEAANTCCLDAYYIGEVDT